MTLEDERAWLRARRALLRQRALESARAELILLLTWRMLWVFEYGTEREPR